jgi:hypothetical protein
MTMTVMTVMRVMIKAPGTIDDLCPGGAWCGYQDFRARLRYNKKLLKENT